MKIIYSTNNEEILVDDEDYDYLKQWNWTVITNQCGGKQINRQEHLTRGRNGLRITYQLCRVVALRMGLNIEGKHVDHEDQNGLNNQRYNLRPATCSENVTNSKMAKNNTSGYRGVYYDYERNKFQSYVTVNKALKHLGRFDTAEQAAMARDLYVFKRHPEFAVLNFPELKQYYQAQLAEPSINGITSDVKQVEEMYLVEALL